MFSILWALSIRFMMPEMTCIQVHMCIGGHEGAGVHDLRMKSGKGGPRKAQPRFRLRRFPAGLCTCLAGADLVRLGEALLQQGLEGLLPEDWADHLLAQDLADDGGIRVGRGIHVGDDRDPRLDDLGLGERLLQLLHCRLHVFRVERAGNG